MFGLNVQRQRTSTASRARRARLVLEALESRDCPTAPPTLTLAATPQMGKAILYTGLVTDNDPTTVVITLGGVASGTITPDSTGAYRYTGYATGLGTATAVARDAGGLTSDTDSIQIISSPPTIQQLSVAYGLGRTVTLSGIVSDESPSGLTVTFSGAVSGSTTTFSDGSFLVQLQASSLGDVQAVVTNPWGLASTPVHATIANSAPQINNFGAVHEFDDLWTFSGTVVDESPQGLRVTFGGLTSLTGQVATTDEHGNFLLTLDLQPGERGIATANVTDVWGVAAAEVACAVINL